MQIIPCFFRMLMSCVDNSLKLLGPAQGGGEVFSLQGRRHPLGRRHLLPPCHLLLPVFSSCARKFAEHLLSKLLKVPRRSFGRRLLWNTQYLNLLWICCEHFENTNIKLKLYLLLCINQISISGQIDVNSLINLLWKLLSTGPLTSLSDDFCFCLKT